MFLDIHCPYCDCKKTKQVENTDGSKQAHNTKTKNANLNVITLTWYVYICNDCKLSFALPIILDRP